MTKRLLILVAILSLTLSLGAMALYLIGPPTALACCDSPWPPCPPACPSPPQPPSDNTN